VSALQAIPEELRALDQWVVWRWETRDGKPTKPPYRTDDPPQHASSTKPETWGTFKQAVAVVETGKADGIGFALAPRFVGVDLDADLSLNEQYAIMLALDSYAEKSPSGAGHHVILKASLNGHGRHPVGIGVFQTGRFFYCTGEHVTGTPTTVEDRQNALEHVIAEYLPTPSSVSGLTGSSQSVDLDDQELLERAFAARNGDRFRRLWEGDWSEYPSQSEADLALVTHLAFWTTRDVARIESMFRSSGLYREEGQGNPKGVGYLARTIEKAIEGTSEVYGPKVRPSRGGAAETQLDSGFHSLEIERAGIENQDLPVGLARRARQEPPRGRPSPSSVSPWWSRTHPPSPSGRGAGISPCSRSRCSQGVRRLASQHW
jgi:putative DNA primase/helicase